ncbi:MAG: hypothetical protein KTR13_01440, partial [Saprospiraceae bacterium]|nr:hypothetical protein [Saprospiraceae bacterium]
LGGKPQVKVLPFLGEHKEVDESITEYYKLPAFVQYSIDGDTLTNESLKKNVRVVLFGDNSTYSSDYKLFEPVLEKYTDYDELQFIYYLQVDQNSSASFEKNTHSNWNIVARSNFNQLKDTHLVTSDQRIALVDRFGHIRGLYDESDFELLSLDFQNLMVENHHQTKKRRRSDRFSREKDKAK